MVLLHCGRVGRRRVFIQQKPAVVSRAFLFYTSALDSLDQLHLSGLRLTLHSPSSLPVQSRPFRPLLSTSSTLYHFRELHA